MDEIVAFRVIELEPLYRFEDNKPVIVKNEVKSDAIYYGKKSIITLREKIKESIEKPDNVIVDLIERKRVELMVAFDMGGHWPKMLEETLFWFDKETKDISWGKDGE